MDRGYHVLVFPEGRLTEDGRLQTFRKGIGLLAAGLNAPVVPVNWTVCSNSGSAPTKLVGFHAPSWKRVCSGRDCFAIWNRRGRGRDNYEARTGRCGFRKVAQR